MLFFGYGLLGLSLWSTSSTAASLATHQTSIDTLINSDLNERSSVCNSPYATLVYETASNHLCLNNFVLGYCAIIIPLVPTVFTQISNTVSGWISSQVQDASTAGGQSDTKRSTITWGELHAYHASTSHAANSFKIPVVNSSNVALTGMDLAEDGYSFSVKLIHDDNSTAVPITSRQAIRCYWQIHVHYWAAAGHAATVLTKDQTSVDVYTALSNSYYNNYEQSCYEMTNGGSWDGFLRVCYNNNYPQAGCYTCGGHDN